MQSLLCCTLGLFNSLCIRILLSIKSQTFASNEEVPVEFLQPRKQMLKRTEKPVACRKKKKGPLNLKSCPLIQNQTKNRGLQTAITQKGEIWQPCEGSPSRKSVFNSLCDAYSLSAPAHYSLSAKSQVWSLRLPFSKTLQSTNTIPKTLRILVNVQSVEYKNIVRKSYNI